MPIWNAESMPSQRIPQETINRWINMSISPQPNGNVPVPWEIENPFEQTTQPTQPTTNSYKFKEGDKVSIIKEDKFKYSVGKIVSCFNMGWNVYIVRVWRTNEIQMKEEHLSSFIPSPSFKFKTKTEVFGLIKWEEKTKEWIDLHLSYLWYVRWSLFDKPKEYENR